MAIINGTSGDDRGSSALVGTADADILYGRGGDDALFGRGRNDVLFGGHGLDTLYGGYGNDLLFGENGHDLLLGAGDNDQLFGGHGRDTLDGGGGNDTLHGGHGQDFLYGGSGDDAIYGGYGVDRLYGGSGNDRFREDYEGYANRDFFYGGGGGDVFEVPFTTVATARHIDGGGGRDLVHFTVKIIDPGDDFYVFVGNESDAQYESVEVLSFENVFEFDISPIFLYGGFDVVEAISDDTLTLTLLGDPDDALDVTFDTPYTVTQQGGFTVFTEVFGLGRRLVVEDDIVIY